jgi:hypothetical protein
MAARKLERTSTSKVWKYYSPPAYEQPLLSQEHDSPGCHWKLTPTHVIRINTNKCTRLYRISTRDMFKLGLHVIKIHKAQFIRQVTKPRHNGCGCRTHLVGSPLFEESPAQRRQKAQ